MKRIFLKKTGAILLFMSFSIISYADDFTDALQGLCVEAACVGVYSATQSGGGWYEDPYDYYTPNMCAEYFADISGDKTRTETFYGVCFDYAQYAYNFLERDWNWYKSKGAQQYFIVGVDDNPNVMTLFDPVPENRVRWSNGYCVDSWDGRALEKHNGVYLKKNRTMYVTTHENATHHAWVLIQRNNGTWYWIDPTWTDNTGYVWYGYISGSSEIQYIPDQRYAVVDLSRSSSSSSSSSSSGSSSSMTSTSYSYSGFDLDLFGDYNFVLGIGYSRPFDGLFSSDFSNGGISIAWEDGNIKKIFGIIQCDVYLRNENKLSLLFDYSLGYQWESGLGIYAGGGAGWSKDRDNFLSFNEKYFDDAVFEWKANAGLRMIFKRICVRFDAAYVNNMGWQLGSFVGYAF